MDILVTWAATASGGAERSTLELAEAMASAGHNVVVLWYDLGCPAPRGDLVLVRGVKSTDDYVGVVRESLPRIVLSSHRTFLLDSAAGAVPTAAVFRGTPQADSEIRILQNSPVGWRIGHVRTKEIPWQIPSTIQWVAPSRTAAAALQAMLGRHVVAISNGVTTPRRVGRPAVTGYNLAIVGRLTAWKKVDWAIGALARPDRTIHIVGDGPARPSVQRAARDANGRVILRGQVPDVAPVLDEMALLVHPNPDEGFGRVVVDAARRFVPAIVARGSGAEEQIVDRETGLVFEPNNRQSLDSAIDTFFGMPSDQQAAMGAAAAEYAEAFWPERTAHQYLRLLEK